MNLRIFTVLKALIASFAREDGQDLVEYGLVVALVALAAAAGLRQLGTIASTLYSSISQNIHGVIG